MIAAARSSRLAAALLLQIAALCTPLDAIAADTKRMLLLQSFGREFAPYDVSVEAFRSELAKGSSEPVAVYEASLDAGQAFGSGDPEPLLAFLRHRFAGSPPDVVVTVGPPAAAFYAQNRDKVFPGTPLVMALLDQRFVRKSALHAGDAVVAVHLDLPALVNNILRVLPDTQTIAVVLGDSPLERFWLVEAQREFAQFADRIHFEWLNKLSLE